MKPIVSITVAIYNVGDYLERCLESISQQSYPDLEIILVDDGSTDGTSDLIQAYKEIDERVVIIKQEHYGLSIARNVGIDISTGEYITFVDGDDYIDEKMIEVLMCNAVIYSAQLSSCWYRRVDVFGCELNENKRNNIKDNESNIITLLCEPSQKMKYFLENGISSGPWGILFSRELFDEIRFPPGRIYEDLFIMHELVGKAKTIIKTGEKYYFYVKRPNSIVENTEKEFDMVYGALERLKYISEQYPQFTELCSKAVITSLIVAVKNLIKKNKAYLLYGEIKVIKDLIIENESLKEIKDPTAKDLLRLLRMNENVFIEFIKNNVLC